MTAENIDKILKTIECHQDFMFGFGWKSGFYEGWQDALSNLPFRKEYETQKQAWQYNYEQGREAIFRLRAIGVKPNLWKNKYKPGPHLWRNIKPIFDGKA